MTHTRPNYCRLIGFALSVFWLILLGSGAAAAQAQAMHDGGAATRQAPTQAQAQASTRGTRAIPCIWKNGYQYNQDIYLDISSNMPDGKELRTITQYVYANPHMYCTAWATTDVYVGIKNSSGPVPGLSRAYYSSNRSLAYNVIYARDDGVDFYPNPQSLGRSLQGGAGGANYSIGGNVIMTFFKYGMPTSAVTDRACFNHWYNDRTYSEDFCVNIHITPKNPTCSAQASAIQLNLGARPASSLPSVGSATPTTDYQNIHLKCQDSPPVRVRFEGNTVAGRDDVFEVNKSGAYATGVGIQLYRADQIVTAGTSYVISSGAANDTYIPMRARYLRTGTNMTAGAANATIRAVIDYD